MTQSSSQIYQDIFVDFMLDGRPGTFLDVGAGNGGLVNHPVWFMSNTYSLEKYRNWNGICVDFDERYIERAKTIRSSTMICADLTKIPLKSILEENAYPKMSEYMSLDVDDATENVLDTFDFSEYRFKIITYEHNLFQSQDTSDQVHTEEHKREVVRTYKKSREILTSFGYKILFGNVGLRGYGFVEDWYVDPKYFNNELLLKLEDSDMFCEEIIQKIINHYV